MAPERHRRICPAALTTTTTRSVSWPGAEGDCLPHARYADTLKKIGFDGDCCTIEIFRPAYYEMSQEENVKKSAEVTRAHVEKYAQF